MIRHREVKPKQAHQGTDQALSLAQRQAEDSSDGQRRRDRQG